MDYYCRFCDEFVASDEVVEEALEGALITPTGNMLEIHETCPTCGNLLFEEANECVCSKLKLKDDILCRDCYKVASEEWKYTVKRMESRIGSFVSDETLEIYVRSEIFKEQNDVNKRNTEESK